MIHGDEQLNYEHAAGLEYHVSPAGVDPNYTTQPAREKARLGNASLATAIGAILAPIPLLAINLTLGSLFLALVTFPATVVAIVLGHRGLRAARRTGSSKGTSIAGMVIGYVFFAGYIVPSSITALIFYLVATATSGA